MRYASEGLAILAFPCNQFFHQEPGTAEVVKSYIRKTGANFTIFEKSDINGSRANCLFKYLRRNSRLNGKRICWNFGKFLIDKSGNIVQYYGFSVYPLAMIPEIERIL